MQYLFIVLLVFSSTNFFCQGHDSKILSGDLLEHITYLTSPELKGRLSGSDGYNKVSKYAAEIFKKLELKHLWSEDYYQPLNVEYNNIDGPVGLSLFTDDTREELKLGEDFVCRGFTGSGNMKAEVIFCGYGLSLPGYDDYTGIDVSNKVVLMFKQGPSWNIDGLTPDMSLPRYKTNLASEHGAKAVLFVSKPNIKEPQKLIISVLHGIGEQPITMPQLHVDIPIANKILSKTKFDLSKLQSIIDSTKSPISLNSNELVEINVHAEYYKQKQTQNVVALLEGNDDKLKNEFIIVGAHLDHVGNQTDNFYAPGANDNASGSAAVLEIAKALTKIRAELKRSVILVLFASEEQGLFGSQYFADNLPVPIEKVTAMINLDCIGYGDSIQVGNGKSAPELWNIAKAIDKSSSKMMVNNTWSGGGADATPFFAKGIPALYFVSTNSYKYLHLPGDTVGTLNSQLLEDITNLALETVTNISKGDYLREKVIK